MTSNPWFYQLLMAALVLVCLIIHTPVKPIKPRRKRSKEPKPFAGYLQQPLCEACEHGAARRLKASGSPPPIIRFNRGSQAHHRYEWVFLSRSRLLVSRLARAWQYPRQWPSRWSTLAPISMCVVPRIFLRDARHDFPWQAFSTRPHRACHRLSG